MTVDERRWERRELKKKGHLLRAVDGHLADRLEYWH
jgi:hypothetical protein